MLIRRRVIHKQSAAEISEQQEKSLELVLAQLTGETGPVPGVLKDRRNNGCRRDRSIWAFLYGNIRPRRRDSRRADDQHLFIVDWHEPRVLFLALGILLLSCLDALFTLNLLSAGAAELNLIMDVLIAHSIELFLAIKIGLTAVSVVLLVIVARRKFWGSFRVLHVMQLLCLGYVVLIGYEIHLLARNFVWN
jgi:hypothetical protein